MARWPSGRRVKIHRTYTVAEVADLLGAHKRTVRRWIAAGLPTTDDKRPVLIHGADLRAFLKARSPAKKKCGPGEFFCVRCREPKRPAEDMADYVPRTSSRGSLCGICPTCCTMIYRAVSQGAIPKISAGLNIAFPRAESRLDDSSSPLPNVDFKQDRRK